MYFRTLGLMRLMAGDGGGEGGKGKGCWMVRVDFTVP